MINEFLFLGILISGLQLIGLWLFFNFLDGGVILFHIPAESNLTLFGKIFCTLLLCGIFPLTFILYLLGILSMITWEFLLKRLFVKTENIKGEK